MNVTYLGRTYHVATEADLITLLSALNALRALICETAAA